MVKTMLGGVVAGWLVLAWSAAAAAGAVADPGDEEQWYVILHNDERVGYMQTATRHEPGADRITSTQEVKLSIARGGTPVEIAVGSSFTETAAGRPIEAESRVDLGAAPMVSRAVFHDGRIEVTTGQQGRTSTQVRRPIEGDWLAPAAMRRHVEARLAAGAEQIEVRTLDLSMGLTPVSMSMRVQGPTQVEVYGKTLPAIAWEATTSALPGMTMRDFVDERGQTIKSTMSLMPGFELTVLRADQALALSELTPAEMMAQTFVVPSRPIERPRQVRRAVYRLTPIGAELAARLPSGGVQTVAGFGSGSKAQGTAIVTVDMTLDDVAEFPGGRYLEASPILNHEDPAVRAWLEPLASMTFAAPADRAVAEWLRGQVFRRVKSKDLSVGFATASEVARTRQGDCTEHAVLLAALLRGAGIPSRTVSGLIYADQFAGHEGIFGYHMWTQAWIAAPAPGIFPAPGIAPGIAPGTETVPEVDGEQPVMGRWIDLDATLPAGVRFDATHIALSVSDLNEGSMGNDMAVLGALMGRLEVEVVETGY
jgi:transglutaminase-like putative cysteine protease